MHAIVSAPAMTNFEFWLAMLVPPAILGFGLAHITSDSLRVVTFVMFILAPAIAIGSLAWLGGGASSATPDASLVAPAAFAWSSSGVVAFLAARRLAK